MAAILDALAHTTSGAPTFTPSAGTDRIAFIAVVGYHFSDAVPPTSATFGGQAMELIGSEDGVGAAVAVFALRESGIAAMSGNTFTPSGQTLSVWSTVYWSVEDAAQAAGITTDGTVSSSAISLSLTRAADSYSVAISVMPVNDIITLDEPGDTATAFLQTAYQLTYGGEADTARTANFTATSTGAEQAAIVLNIAAAGGGGGSNSNLFGGKLAGLLGGKL